jgi:DNA modification methylase
MSAFGKERDDLLGLHPTVKPVAMIADALRDVTRRGEIVLDTFLGSGSTLIAAQETGRICCGVELDPLYIDVAIRRWQKITGREAVQRDTGESFNYIAQRLLEAPRS